MKMEKKPGMVVDNGNPTSMWVETGDQEPKGSLGYTMRPCFKGRKENE